MIKQVAAIGLALGMVGSANAALFSRAGGTMVYDDVLNITWLADWNYAYTSGYAAANQGGSTFAFHASDPFDSVITSTIITADGRMGWDAAMRWAEELKFGGYNDWRLPSSISPSGAVQLDVACFGNGAFYCSEMQYMFFYNWGLSFGTTAGNPNNVAMFYNVVNEWGYWSSTEYIVNYFGELRVLPGWAFWFGQTIGWKGDPRNAVAVRDGDVANVPVPATLALLGLGLVGIAGLRSSRSTGRGAAQ